ncbi:glycerophosphodiester phosphodiesterase family protein [Pararhodobacter sp.]|uniref:glycerophosphodiester phosphodiesterase family protein n=1 Tax=Pararhodobacter sp. TaxID=2127056 RepID=UPI002FDE002D
MRAPLHPDFLTRPIAHRALHDLTQNRPENSLAAVQAAVEAGYGIEIDLQPSADGIAMVFHDATLDRMTSETGPVADRSAAELAAIALNHGAGTGMPTLTEVLRAVAGRVPLLIEVKDQSGSLGPVDGALERAAVDALEGYEGPVALMSFNPHSVAALAEAAPHIARGLTTYAFPASDFPQAQENPALEARRAALAAIADYERTGASFISHQWADLTRPRVAELKAQGAAILCWTIRSPEQEAQARRIAQNITFEQYLPAPVN